MKSRLKNLFKHFNVNFALVILAITIIGIINVYSATHDNSEGLSKTFISQSIWLGLGWLIFLALSLVDYKVLLRLAWPFWLFNLAMLILLHFKGKTIYGSQRWLDLGIFNYQPSETAKISLIILLAAHLRKVNPYRGMGFKDLFFPFLYTLPIFFLIVKQPDLGTGLIILAIVTSMVTFMKIRKAPLVTAVTALLIAAPLIWSFALKPYQKQRVVSFLDPGRDPRGAGYNSIQSKIAVGSGETSGKGFLKGTQAQFDFLPERHTDFIFSVLSEEHGFIGSILLLSLFFTLFVLCLRIAVDARDSFGSLLVIGFSSYIFWHTIVNIGMVIGILPVVGVPLPLVSYGGTGMISVMFGLGIISAVSYRRYLF